MLQATASERLAQGPYVVARVGFEPATLWTQGTELITRPPRPQDYDYNDYYYLVHVILRGALTA